MQQSSAVVGLQRPKRLIQEQDNGLRQEQPRQGDPLHLMGQQGMGTLQGDEPIQARALQQFLEGKGLQGLLQILISEEGARQQQVLPQGSREDPSVFRQEGHRLTQLPQGDLAQIRAVQGDHAAAWGDLGIDQTQNRGRA